MLGPIEVLVVGFPGNRFTGGILPELEALVEAGTISIVDGLFITKDADGDVTFVELDQIDENEDAAALGRFIGSSLDLLSDDDAAEFAAALEPNSSAAALKVDLELQEALITSASFLNVAHRCTGDTVTSSRQAGLCRAMMV